ncbi:unnamed protein product [Staurois parvus]|uniref:Uncharacterized protein n=1 Tax=Staurois parvus TaxID=386267 RepID=A0ABN9FVX5_9NEOB|nr:unnamed protein product [Staurois parvus]
MLDKHLYLVSEVSGGESGSRITLWCLEWKRGGLTIWKLGHYPRPRAVGGPMRCNWYLFHRLF